MLRPWISDLMISLSLKYDGARPLRHLKAIAASLNLSYPRLCDLLWFSFVFRGACSLLMVLKVCRNSLNFHLFQQLLIQETNRPFSIY